VNRRALVRTDMLSGRFAPYSCRVRIAAWATCLGLIGVLTACAATQHASSEKSSPATARAASTPAASTPAASTPATQHPSADYSGTNTAHGCGRQNGPIVTMTVNPDGIAPSLGCVQIGGAQRLRIVNNTSGFGYKGETIRMSVRGLPALTVQRHTAWTSPEPISSSLAVGQHFGTCTCGSDEPWRFVVWVV
jgi:hypothetical protein